LPIIFHHTIQIKMGKFIVLKDTIINTDNIIKIEICNQRNNEAYTIYTLSSNTNEWNKYITKYGNPEDYDSITQWIETQK